MDKTRFLFVNAINPSKEIETLYPPLGIGYLISNLKLNFGEDSIEFRIIEENVENQIRKFNPQIVGISAVSQNYNRAIEYAKIAKKYKLPVICGGVHISAMPSSLTEQMDVGILGEGEETICELFGIFKSKGEFRPMDLQKIRGLVYRDENGKICLTSKRELIQPMDRIPLPDRSLLRIKSHTYMFTSRGCPYRCIFCASSRFWDKVRIFSAHYVVNEIEYLINLYGVKTISFYDDLFIVDKKRMKEILKLLEERNILGKVIFGCQARANLIDDEVVQLLKKVGVKSICLGLESGCDSTLKYLKGNVNIADNQTAIKTIRKYNLNIFGSFVIGSPEETKEDIIKTLKFVRKSPLNGFDVYVLTPFPGTPVWDYAKSRSLVSEKMDWDKLDVDFATNYDSAIILSEKLTRKEIYRLFLQFMKEKKRKKIISLIKKGLKNPLKIPKFFITKFREIYSKKGVK